MSLTGWKYLTIALAILFFADSSVGANERVVLDKIEHVQKKARLRWRSLRCHVLEMVGQRCRPGCGI